MRTVADGNGLLSGPKTKPFMVAVVTCAKVWEKATQKRKARKAFAGFGCFIKNNLKSKVELLDNLMHMHPHGPKGHHKYLVLNNFWRLASLNFSVMLADIAMQRIWMSLSDHP